MIHRKPFHGPKRRLVLSMDLGTTFSGMSYAVLDPGKAPEIKTVNRYPGQEAGDAKIPTVVWYDSNGQVLAVGAEEPSEPPVEDPEWQDDAVDEWEDVPKVFKVEWFKLLLGPKGMHTDPAIPSIKLPPGKQDVLEVYADFYRYMYGHARTYIEQTHANGDLLWESFGEDIDFILSHPNGWEGAQQSAMRRAAIKAELVPDTLDGRERVKFVTEGEASFHCCISSGMISESVEIGKNVMIVDAGGGTVDISTYTFTKSTPIAIDEIAASGCIFQGSVLVSSRASAYLRQSLASSRFGSESHIQAITTEFDKTTKKRFKGTGDSWVKFGQPSDRDLEFGIRNGQKKLTVDEIASFFDPAIRDIMHEIEAQQRAAKNHVISTFFLVGGFAASEYLYTKLRGQLEAHGSQIFRPDSHTNKAVAEGAVSFHLDHYVSSRVARFVYGVECRKLFVSHDRDHRSRFATKEIAEDGTVRLPKGFSIILPKGTQVSETEEFERSFYQSSRTGLYWIESTILCYKGRRTPSWTDEEPGLFSALCTVSADVSQVPKIRLKGPSGRYFRQDYEIVLSFGLTELKARISWMENGVKKFGPASIVYDEN
ncbi:hypothetical protein HETIRDRAFT_154793 [Heterobasidion irregulare TC 32-1]|uniref:Uncharacterized protein n=1 Tax=Heterobasidion irregulare (strain TC 32-1) TaxID=747525 RepID=W4K4Z5_HETIT|nr:uncharacterized protein HETIRDRAFT_154793 [Heterobasidion irregulare TC 32-1]ETW80440.1 hypothetical protein HETIRDRAFT_154793 [Heterobasidion irregulare TC 32-1]